MRRIKKRDMVPIMIVMLMYIVYVHAVNVHCICVCTVGVQTDDVGFRCTSKCCD